MCRGVAASGRLAMLYGLGFRASTRVIMVAGTLKTKMNTDPGGTETCIKRTMTLRRFRVV